MARVRQGKLLRGAPATAAVLVGVLLGIAPAYRTASAQEYPEDPVFFTKPDSQARARIKTAFDLLERASASDHTRGREILSEIGYWAVDPLRKLIYDGNYTQRRNAGLTLGTILDPRALPDLVKVAREDQQDMPPSFAALMIGKFRDPSTLPFLKELILSGRKSHRQRSSVLSVAKFREQAAYDILTRVVREERGTVRETAIFLLGFFRKQALVPGDGGVAEPCRLLRIALASSDENERRGAMLALALLGHRDLKPYYWRSASNDREDAEIRRIALLALARFPDDDVTDLVLAVLGNPTVRGRVREMAAMILKDRPDPRVLAALKKFSPDDVKLRAALTLALSNFDDPDAVKIVLRRLWDPKDQICAAAAIGLSRTTDPEGREIAISAISRRLKESVETDVKYDLQLARDILEGEEVTKEFRWVGNRAFAVDLPKDIEERILDAVNNEVERVLEIASLTQIKADRGEGTRRFRRDDEYSDLRDLEEYLMAHPYFEPDDIPEPKVVITPKVERK